VEAAARAAADAVAGDRDGEMTLAGAGSADQHGVALLLKEGAGGELTLSRSTVMWVGLRSIQS